MATIAISDLPCFMICFLTESYMSNLSEEELGVVVVFRLQSQLLPQQRCLLVSGCICCECYCYRLLPVRSLPRLNPLSSSLYR